MKQVPSSSEKKRILAVIPARGGSKRLPGKNIRKLNGKPLVNYTVEAAVASGVFQDIWISSDDDEILQLADAHQEVTPVKRSQTLAKDTTKVLELMNVIAGDAALKGKYDVLALLLPTCPFRLAEDIRRGIDRLTAEVDSVVSFTAYEFPHAMSVTVDGETGLISPVFEPCPLITGNTRSQDHASVYRPNGAFYMAWWGKFLVNRNYFVGNVQAYIMDRLHSVDIDSQADFEYAEFLLRAKHLQMDFP